MLYASGLAAQGRGASAEGNRPFVDVLDLETKETQRLWRSSPPYYESTGASMIVHGPSRQALPSVVERPKTL